MERGGGDLEVVEGVGFGALGTRMVTAWFRSLLQKMIPIVGWTTWISNICSSLGEARYYFKSIIHTSSPDHSRSQLGPFLEFKSDSRLGYLVVHMRSTPVDSFDGGPPLTSYSIRISFRSLDLVRWRLLYTYMIL